MGQLYKVSGVNLFSRTSASTMFFTRPRRRPRPRMFFKVLSEY
jgi:hypothetical protein